VKHHNSRGEQRSSVSRSEFNALKKQVGELTKTNPPRPEDVVARQAMKGEKPSYLHITRGNADYEGPVKEHLARVGGRSRSDVVSDRDRRAGSPLGHGEAAKRRP